MDDLISRKQLKESLKYLNHHYSGLRDRVDRVDWYDLKTIIDNLPAANLKGFTVIDKKTGLTPDYEKLGIEYKLCYCDMEGFAIGEDGELYLLDECGKWEWPAQDRFEVRWDGSDRKTDGDCRN